MKKLTQQATYWLSVVAIGLVVGLSIQFVTAWTEPSATPPGGNLGAPINTSSIGQSKEGGVVLNTAGAANGLLVQLGKVGIGNTTPGANHTVAGQPLVALDVRDSVTLQDKIITGVATPQDNNDAANKAYVDAQAGGGGACEFVSVGEDCKTSSGTNIYCDYAESSSQYDSATHLTMQKICYDKKGTNYYAIAGWKGIHDNCSTVANSGYPTRRWDGNSWEFGWRCTIATEDFDYINSVYCCPT